MMLSVADNNNSTLSEMEYLLEHTLITKHLLGVNPFTTLLK